MDHGLRVFAAEKAMNLGDRHIMTDGISNVHAIPRIDEKIMEIMETRNSYGNIFYCFHKIPKSKTIKIYFPKNIQIYTFILTILN